MPDMMALDALCFSCMARQVNVFWKFISLNFMRVFLSAYAKGGVKNQCDIGEIWCIPSFLIEG